MDGHLSEKDTYNLWQPFFPPLADSLWHGQVVLVPKVSFLDGADSSFSVKIIIKITLIIIDQLYQHIGLA